MPVKVNLYEKAIQPIVDLDGDVVVYVPGYATKGPSEPTLVTSSNFTALFGDSPYIFTKNQSGTPEKNNTYKGRPEKSWLYAKGLVDAGLTVLYHRVNPQNIGVAKTKDDEGALPLIKADFVTTKKLTVGDDVKYVDKELKDTEAKVLYIYAKAKYFGSYYTDLKIKVSQSVPARGTTTISVWRGATELESQVVSFDPSKNNFIGNVEFGYITFFVKIEEEEYEGFDTLGLDAFYTDEANSGKAIYIEPNDNGYELYLEAKEEFTVERFMTLMAGDKSPFYELRDTDRYQSITYITTGGYYQTAEIVKLMEEIAFDIKSIALIDLPNTVTAENFSTLQQALEDGGTPEQKAKAAMFYGADTYVLSGKTVVMPDSYGYLAKLGSNLAQGIPAWIPVANNPQGVVAATATTRPISNALREMMINENGVSVNPIVYKQNVGYTIMGNRTLKAVDGVTGPDSFLNCQLVVNTVLRAARRAANSLLVVSTNANAAFATFRSSVSKTCEKMMLNGDGLISYSIRKLKKTKPATLDVAIDLTVVEGIETLNVTLDYSLQLDE